MQDMINCHREKIENTHYVSQLQYGLRQELEALNKKVQYLEKFPEKLAEINKIILEINRSLPPIHAESELKLSTSDCDWYQT